MSLCDRCPGGAGCLLDYMGRACKEYRKKNAPEIVATRGDQIRNASDEQLADMFTLLCSTHRKMIIERLQAAGVAKNVCMVEMPLLSKAAHLEWLREPVEEV